VNSFGCSEVLAEAAVFCTPLSEVSRMEMRVVTSEMFCCHELIWLMEARKASAKPRSAPRPP